MKLGRYVIGLAVGLAGCGGQELGRIGSLPPPGGDFNAALYEGYLKLSRGEHREGDYRDSDVFAMRAGLAAAGDLVLPEEISARRLPADQQPVLDSERKRLMQALDGGGRDIASADMAAAQVGFDCWMQEQEENRQPADIAACRSGYETALAKVEDALDARARRLANEKAKREAEAKRLAEEKARREAALAIGSFTVLFAHDSAELTDDAMATIKQAAANIEFTGRMAVEVAGHADRSGGVAYNRKLSRMRAQAVAGALGNAGVDTSKTEVAGFGEDRPALATSDGDRAEANRRVEIMLK